MEAEMRNIQSRTIDAPAASVGALIDLIASDNDPLWPSPAWPPIRLDRGLVTGSRGGHGPIRLPRSGSRTWSRCCEAT